MDLSFTEEQVALQSSIRALFKDKYPLSAVRAGETDPEGALPIYAALSKMGVGAINVSEAHGGLSLGLLESAIVAQEMGRALFPLLFLESSVFAAHVLEHLPHEISAELIALLMSGDARISCIWQVDENADQPLYYADGLLSGRANFVVEPHLATHFLVFTRDMQDQSLLALVRATSGRLEIHSQQNLADLDLGLVEFPGVAVDTVLAQGSSAQTLFESALDRMKVAVAAYAVGGSIAALEMTREYAMTRKQFGQPIGGFQAIAHMLADAAVHLEGARYLTYRAAVASEQLDGRACWADMAKLKATKTYRDITATAIQVHGGIGFTLEAAPQLFYRRAKYLQLMYGTPLSLEDGIGTALLSGEHKVLAA